MTRLEVAHDLVERTFREAPIAVLFDVVLVVSGGWIGPTERRVNDRGRSRSIPGEMSRYRRSQCGSRFHFRAFPWFRSSVGAGVVLVAGLAGIGHGMGQGRLQNRSATSPTAFKDDSTKDA